jgi:tight adherence protein B
MASLVPVILLVAAFGGGLLFVLVRSFSSDGSMKDRMQTYAALPEVDPAHARARQRSRLDRARLRLNSMLSMLNSDELNLQLTRANWRMTVTEFVLIRLALTVAGLLVGWIAFSSVLSGAGLALITYFAPGIVLRRRISRRQIGFERQLIDILVLITGAVRAGFSLLQAVEVVMKEMKPPASEEFKRVLRETGLGLPVPEALRNLAARTENDDFDLMVTAVEIQYQVGGNLATMLSAVTDTIRERVRLFGEVRVLTTQQRYTAYLLSLLPFFIGGMMFIMNPEYMMRIFEPGPILVIPVGALIGIILGHISIKRIARIEV